MSIILTLDNCSVMEPPCIIRILKGGKLPRRGGIWDIENEIKPADIYCYLYAKFGPPNGLQNILRSDDSDNLIHWDWTLGHNRGLIMFLGLNLRTEIHLIGDFDFAQYSKEQFLSYIKNDILNYGAKISEIRKNILENWDVFINPYITLKRSIDQLFHDLSELNINPAKEHLPNPDLSSDLNIFNQQWQELRIKYGRGIGIAMALKIMMPILAESFINLMIFVLCRNDIRKNNRLFDSYVRSNIDIRIQSLHINCNGFQRAVDWQSEQCKKYNSLVNQRNDILHGNIAIDKLKIFDIYFNGKVPVFKQYQSIWQQSIGVSIKASSLNEVEGDYKVVNDFIEYVLSCLNNNIRKTMNLVINTRELGLNTKTGKIGILLPDYLVDFKTRP